MTTTDTATSVKSDLAKLKKAVSTVTKANKSWLVALENYLEAIDPNTTDTTQQQVILSIAAVITAALPGLSGANTQGSGKDMKIDQAVRFALDEVTLLQLADRKLDGS